MNQSDDQLDQLLRQWNEQTQPSEAKLDALHNRISSALKEQVSTDKVGVSREPLPTGTWRNVALRSAVIAALLLLTVGLWWLQPQRINPDSTEPDATPKFAHLEKQQLSNQATLLAEMEQVFNGQLQWVAETDDDGKVQMRLEENATNHGQPLAIRVVLARRDRGRMEWRQLWTVDVVLRIERVVRLNPTSQDGVQLSLWAYVLPDGMIAVDSHFSAANPVAPARLEANSSHLQKPGVPTEVLTSRDDGTEYRVFQTVALLNEA